MGETAWKVLLGIWTAVCLAFLILAFSALPAWDTSESEYFPNGLGLFVLALVLSLVSWFLGLALLFAIDQVVDLARSRRAWRRSQPS